MMMIANSRLKKSKMKSKLAVGKLATICCLLHKLDGRTCLITYVGDGLIQVYIDGTLKNFDRNTKILEAIA